MEEGRGGRKHTASTLGLEVITVLCTRNNWSHQCGCHMESLALPHHRCYPFSGQKPPIKPKLVAKRPLTPPFAMHVPWVRQSSNIYAPVKAQFSSRGNKDGQDAASREYSFLLIQSCSGNDFICTSATKPTVTVHTIQTRPIYPRITAFVCAASHLGTPLALKNINADN